MTKMKKSPTVREFIEVYKDLDAYITHGGKLLDLRVFDLAAMPHPVRTVISGCLGEATRARLGRFFEAMSQLIGADEVVGDVLTEAEARELWREAA
jgi:hypothetical protein